LNLIFYLFIMSECFALTVMNGDKLNQRIGLWRITPCSTH
jgi:hypothetical protein